MVKLILLLIFAPVLFSFVISEPLDFKENVALTTTSTPPGNTPPKVKKIHLNKNWIILPCPPNSKTPKFCSDDFIIDVQTDAVDAENDVFVYEYTVSGGRIIGQGAKVKWDLSGVRTGTYELTAVVDDGGFRSESKNISVEVKECDECHLVCECPTISVTGPANAIAPGQAVTFTANVSGGTQENITYKWTVSKGKIVKGQETPVVEILSETPETPVTATIEIGGLCESCENTASETYVIIID